MNKLAELMGVAGVATLIAVAFAGAPNVAQATHVSCGDVLLVDTTLDEDLTCPTSPGAGLVIGANEIRLDLGGFTLSSGAQGNGVLVLDGVNDVKIKNGIIAGFATGVRANDAYKLTLKDLVFEDNKEGIVVFNSSKVKIKHSSFFFSAALGSLPVPKAIILINDDSVLVENVDAHGYGAGVSFGCIMCDGSDPTNGVVKGSTFGGNFIGVEIKSSTGAKISKNHMSDCVELPTFPCTGITAGFFAPVSGLKIEHNHVHGNRTGILLIDVEDSEASGNHVRDNGSNGILLVDTDDSEITENLVNDNGGDGIALTSGSTGNEIEENTATGNTAADISHDVSSFPNDWEDNVCGTNTDGTANDIDCGTTD